MLQKTVSVIGGDSRQLTLARMLSEYGFSVKLWGWCEEMSGGIKVCESVIDATDADILIITP